MLKKIATAAVLAGGLMAITGSAFAEVNWPTDDDYARMNAAAKHGNCSVINGSKICTNFNSGSAK